MVNLTKVAKAVEQLEREKKERDDNEKYKQVLKELEIGLICPITLKK